MFRSSVYIKSYDLHFIADFSDRFVLEADMVPEVIKQSRWKRVEETILTANGLVIFDCFARAVAMRKAQQTKMMIRSLSDFAAWANRDTHRFCACSKLHFVLVFLRAACICAHACKCEHIEW